MRVRPVDYSLHFMIDGRTRRVADFVAESDQQAIDYASQYLAGPPAELRRGFERIARFPDDDYAWHAAEAEQHARTARDPFVKLQWDGIAANWQALAQFRARQRHPKR